MKVDLLIQGGTIIDPSQGMHERGNIAVSGNRIQAVPDGELIEADQIIDADGCYVTPGLIDLHTHMNYLGSAGGLEGDAAFLPNGVTAAADAGSVGVSNYRALLYQSAGWQIKTKFYLNVSAGGQIMSSQFSEPLDPEKWDEALFREALFRYPERVIGLKVRTSRKVVGDLGLKPLKAAVALAEKLSIPLVVHPTDPPIPMGEIAQMLPSGSILCHIFQGIGMTAATRDGLSDGLLEAQKRGVIFDVAHGRKNFDFTVASRALASGLDPDTISTDLSAANWNRLPLVSLPVVMGKFLALGKSIDWVIDRTTRIPAQILGEKDEWGTLKPGTCADVAILREIPKKSVFYDCFGNQLTGKSRLVACTTILDGKIVYRSADML